MEVVKEVGGVKPLNGGPGAAAASINQLVVFEFIQTESLMIGRCFITTMKMKILLASS